MNKTDIRHFIQETGALITEQGKILTIIDGTPGSVDFPPDIIWNYHKMSPGMIYALSHVHPPHMTNLSARDKLTLKTWAHAIFPYPIRIITISETRAINERHIQVTETCFLGVLESKESWIQRGKEGSRKFEIIKEWVEKSYFDLQEIQKTDNWYGRILLDKSYGKVL